MLFLDRLILIRADAGSARTRSAPGARQARTGSAPGPPGPRQKPQSRPAFLTKNFESLCHGATRTVGHLGGSSASSFLVLVVKRCLCTTLVRGSIPACNQKLFNIDLPRISSPGSLAGCRWAKNGNLVKNEVLWNLGTWPLLRTFSA